MATAISFARQELAATNTSAGSSGGGVATVVKTVGKVVAMDTDGNIRQLKPGDVVYRFEKIITENGESIVLVDNNGVVLTLDEMQTAELDGCNFDEFPIVMNAEGETYLSSNYAYGTFDAVIFQNSAEQSVLTNAVSGDIQSILVGSEGDISLTDTLLTPITTTTTDIGIVAGVTPSSIVIPPALPPVPFPGFVFNGLAPGSNFGTSVSYIGDVNNDGFADFAVGAPGNTTYLLFGNNNVLQNLDAADGSLDQYINLSFLDGSNGYQIKAGTNSGESVSFVGDVNGDTFADFIIGSDTDNVSYLIYGGASNLQFLDAEDGQTNGVIDLAFLTSEWGYTLVGDVGQNAGKVVNSAGDLNFDGFSDLYITSTDTNTIYVIFGGVNYLTGETTDVINLSNIGKNPGQLDIGYIIEGGPGGENAGASIAFLPFVPDPAVMNDESGGYGILIGAPNISSNGHTENGQVYFLFDGANSLNILDTQNDTLPEDLRINLTDLGSFGTGITFSGENSGDLLGSAVSSAGDINGDGFADILMGAPGANGGAGAVYVISGDAKEDANDANSLSHFLSMGGDLGNLPAEFGNFKINGIAGSELGTSLSFAGDFNGDGFGDIIIGAPGLGASGTTYILFGGDLLGTLDALDGNLDKQVDLSFFVDREYGFLIEGLASGDNASEAVRAAGDVNGDGFADVLVGAPNAFGGTGQAYVVYGSDVLNSVTHQGTTGNDTLVGTTAPDILIGGEGNDTLWSNGGEDVLIGGAGNDILAIHPAEFLDPNPLNFPKHVDGGTGFDTLLFEGDIGDISDPLSLKGGEGDPFGLLTLQGIDMIDLNGSNSEITGAQTGGISLEINLNTILYLLDSYQTNTSTPSLLISGDAQDSVTIGGGFTPAAQNPAHPNYVFYQHPLVENGGTGITIGVHQDVQVNLVP